MDNIVITTLALQKRRQTIRQKPNWRKPKPRYKAYRNPAFDRWLDSIDLKPPIILYRVSGVRDFIAKPNFQIRISFMPCILDIHASTLYPLFQENAICYVYVKKVAQHKENWLAIDAAVARFPEQTMVFAQFPQKYVRKIKQIEAQIIHPDSNSLEQPMPFFKFASVSNCFHRFRILYHPSNQADKRYGIISQMWNRYDQSLEYKLPPDLDFLS